MSEEILKALMQLFAIIAKQDEGASKEQLLFVSNFLSHQLPSEKVTEYLSLYQQHLQDGTKAEKIEEPGEAKASKLTSVKDSVRTLGICKKINKTLSQKQKVVVLIRLYELIQADGNISSQRMGIIDTVSTVFNISKEERQLLEHFSLKNEAYTYDSEDFLVIDNNLAVSEGLKIKHIHTHGLDSFISVIRVKSVDLYFLKYRGKSDIFINGLAFNQNSIYLFPSGSTIRLPQGTVYYSDIISKFLSDNNQTKLSFIAQDIEFHFPNGSRGLHPITIRENSGKLIGLMGASGAGKTTLLNVLSGIETPSKGSVKINGIDYHKEKSKLSGLVGFIPQDDLLIEELSVFDNLYFGAQLCFKNLTKEELTEKVNKTLGMLGLFEKKDIKVGNPLDKKISGGQRKRLNIALELIREPSILFVDEPTSGLSSRDSENVMDLLKELSLKGKLIFVVIHQPSSDIYKMFDKIMLMDTGGYPIYYGNPIEAVIYFKKAANQLNADAGECLICGNVNPELLFNIIETKVVDEFGQFQDERKTKPLEWNQKYLETIQHPQIETPNTKPENEFNPPSKLKQTLIYFTRDLKSKLSNSQYLILNALEAPLLALILSSIIRYTKSEDGAYLFRENDNIPAYIFMSIIVSLFIGLTVSAEEIFRDRKILKRESFLKLSRFSYLISKVKILFILSAFQALFFVLIGNTVLEIKGMYFSYWLALFTIFSFANVLGLNISATFNSAVTIYIIIPLLIIPQMILGGAMFDYEKLNKYLGGGHQVPIIAETMASRWIYEGLIVEQYKNNAFEKHFFTIDQKSSLCDYKITYYVPKLQELVEHMKDYISIPTTISKERAKKSLPVLLHELKKESILSKQEINPDYFQLKLDDFNEDIIADLENYLLQVKYYYTSASTSINEKRQELLASFNKEGAASYRHLFDNYFNKSVKELVKRELKKDKLLIKDNAIHQLTDPIYISGSSIGLRAPFYIGNKNFLKKPLSTFTYNILVVWGMTLLLFVLVYFDGLKKMLGLFSKK